jgi:hypothetical protein
MRRFPARAAAAWLRVTAAAVLLAALFAGRAAHAGSVTDCGDSPPDATTTLRGVVAAAANSDYVDVSQCSTITLLYGAVSTALTLTIQGKLDVKTTIDAGLNDRAFVDTGGASTLTLDHLVVVHGRAPGLDPNGGCVLATNAVYLQNTILSDCAATSNNGIAHGGAVNASVVTLTSSSVLGSTASSANADAHGGGVYAAAQITCVDSLVQSNNSLSGSGLATGPFGEGGGVYSNIVTLTRCAVAGNHASHSGGGVFGFSAFASDSTISGNTSDFAVGGIAIANTPAAITNSTIAFNHGGTCGGYFGPSGSYINSSILADNTADTPTGCHDVNAGFGVGTNNIVGVADAGVTLPVDTYVGDPQLTPLGDHGGPTPTHALQAAGYAVDHGNNANGLDTDQRSTGYARVVNGVADIGAYERQVDDDEIFYSGM